MGLEGVGHGRERVVGDDLRLGERLRRCGSSLAGRLRGAVESLLRLLHEVEPAVLQTALFGGFKGFFGGVGCFECGPGVAGALLGNPGEVAEAFGGTLLRREGELGLLLIGHVIALHADGLAVFLNERGLGIFGSNFVVSEGFGLAFERPSVAVGGSERLGGAGGSLAKRGAFGADLLFERGIARWTGLVHANGSVVGAVAAGEMLINVASPGLLLHAAGVSGGGGLAAMDDVGFAGVLVVEVAALVLAHETVAVRRSDGDVAALGGGEPGHGLALEFAFGGGVLRPLGCEALAHDLRGRGFVGLGCFGAGFGGRAHAGGEGVEPLGVEPFVVACGLGRAGGQGVEPRALKRLRGGILFNQIIQCLQARHGAHCGTVYLVDNALLLPLPYQ